MDAHTHPALCPPNPSPRKHMSICARGFPNSLARCFPHEPCCPEREKKQKTTRRQKTGLGESSQPHWPHPWGRGHQGPQASGSPPLSSISSRPGEARSPRAPCVLSIKCVGKIVKSAALVAGAHPSELAYLLSPGLLLIEARRLAESPRPHSRGEGMQMPSPPPPLTSAGPLPSLPERLSLPPALPGPFKWPPNDVHHGF